MIHIILDQQNNKGMINITGSNLEVANDFSNFIHKLYEATPDLYLLFLKVLEDHAKELIEEEEAKHDKNNSNN